MRAEAEVADARRELVLTVSDSAAVNSLSTVRSPPARNAGERTTTTLTPANFRQYLTTH